MKLHLPRLLPILLTPVATLALLGCPTQELRFGAVVPLTGEAQTFGTSIQKGIELAVETAQKDPAFETPILVPIVDSQSDPELAAEQLADLYRDGALAAVGGVTSAEALAMIPVADRFDRVLLSPSASNPDLTGASKNFYRVFPSDFRSASKMAITATEQLGIDELVIVAEEEQAYASGVQEVMREEFERLGGKVVEVVEFPTNTTDFSGIVDRVMTLDPPAVYLASYDVAIGALIKALRAANYKGRILTTSAFSTPSAIGRVGEDAEGVILTQSVFEPQSEHAHVRAFVEAYREKYGEDPDIYAAHGYDAMMVLIEAMKGRTLLPSEVPKGMREEFEGVAGAIRFDDKGDVQKYPRVYIIGEGGLLFDYTERLEEDRRRIQRQREEIQRRLRELQSGAGAG